MVDVERLMGLVDRIRSEVAALRALAGRNDLADDEVAMPAAKYRLVVAVEAAIDAAEHIIASEGLRAPTSFADAFTALHEADLLDEVLAGRMARAARQRNLLVHGYADVDDERVVADLAADLDDLDAYASAIAESAVTDE